MRSIHSMHTEASTHQRRQYSASATLTRFTQPASRGAAASSSSRSCTGGCARGTCGHGRSGQDKQQGAQHSDGPCDRLLTACGSGCRGAPQIQRCEQQGRRRTRRTVDPRGAPRARRTCVADSAATSSAGRVPRVASSARSGARRCSSENLGAGMAGSWPWRGGREGKRTGAGYRDCLRRALKRKRGETEAAVVGGLARERQAAARGGAPATHAPPQVVSSPETEAQPSSTPSGPATHPPSAAQCLTLSSPPLPVPLGPPPFSAPPAQGCK